MPTEDDQRAKRIAREQGDVNTTPNREKYWTRNLQGEARTIFEDDKTYFMQQALSTPVLNVLSRAPGARIVDMQGRAYLDMHSNGVHNAGFNNPEVVQAVIQQLESGLTFCPRRYTNQPASRGSGHKTGQAGDRKIQDHLLLGFVPRCRLCRCEWGGEAHFKGGMGPMMPGALHVEFPNYYRNPWGFKSQDDVDAECLRQIELK